jgi:acetyltransferase-like isoleucine patch superfamily enzyme
VTIASGAIISGIVRLHAGIFRGTGSAIGDGVTVHEGAIVGFDSVVAKHGPPDEAAIGNPARALPS